MMESLDLWAWKKEPISPKSLISDVDDKWLNIDVKSELSINDYDTNEVVLYDEEDASSDYQSAAKFLEELDDEWIKEEPFSDWLEDKVLLFDELPPPECGQNKPVVQATSATSPPIKQHNDEPELTATSTEFLLQEFETVFGGVEACHQIYPSGHLTLTPPQSPPAPSTPPDEINQSFPIDNQQLLLTLQPQTSPVISQYEQQDIQSTEQETTLNKTYFNQISGDWNAENLSLAPLTGDVDSELAAVDEYVRSCAEDMSPSSPCTSSNSSYSSEDSTDDPDWPANSSSASSSKTTTSTTNKYVSKQRNQRLTKTRTKPYSRPSIEDKKVRKKEQNKNAAIRYRQKKKAESKEIASEEQELIDYNEKLNEQVKDLEREIGYLKGFMRDLCKAKGLIK